MYRCIVDNKPVESIISNTSPGPYITGYKHYDKNFMTITLQ